jgi:hypothetical protein
LRATAEARASRWKLRIELGVSAEVIP